MSDFPGYDSWKLATPPEDGPDHGLCPKCGEPLDKGIDAVGEYRYCPECGATEREPQPV